MKKCLNCGITADDNLICCPECKGDLVDISGVKITLNEDQIHQIEKRIWRRVCKTLFGGFSILGILSVGFLIWSIYDGYQKAYEKSVEKFEKELTSKIAKEFETERIKETVTTVASTMANETIKKEIAPIVDEFKSETDGKLSDIEKIVDFSMVLIRAQNDDRQAFDKLLDISFGDRGEFAEISDNALWSILMEESPFTVNYTIDYNKHNLNLNKSEIKEFKSFYLESPLTYREQILRDIWEKGKFTKLEKLEFLIDRIQNDNSINIVREACSLLDNEAKLNNNICYYKEYLKWWDENNEQYTKGN